MLGDDTCSINIQTAPTYIFMKMAVKPITLKSKLKVKYGAKFIP